MPHVEKPAANGITASHLIQITARTAAFSCFLIFLVSLVMLHLSNRCSHILANDPLQFLLAPGFDLFLGPCTETSEVFPRFVALLILVVVF